MQRMQRWKARRGTTWRPSWMMEKAEPQAPPGPAQPHRAGFVVLVGPPNAGKSTLLNRLLGEKLAIVTAKPQTTRSRILGIVNRPGAQLLLVDTPGLHASRKKLNAALNEVVGEAVRDCDVALLLVDRSRGWQDEHAALLATLRAAGKPFVVAGTKADLAAAEAAAWPPPEAQGASAVVSLSGRTGEGVADLVQRLIALLPESPPLFPEDQLTDRPLRWLCAEWVREAAFERLGQELPYSIAVEVTRFDESRPGLVEIHADLLVARNSQKRIVVGQGGSMIKDIGIRARVSIEKLLGSRVHLKLFVKVDPHWSENPRRLETLGYR
jgi:GTPase